MHAIITNPDPIRDVIFGSVSNNVISTIYDATISDVRIKLASVGLINLIALKRAICCAIPNMVATKRNIHCPLLYFSTIFDGKRIR